MLPECSALEWLSISCSSFTELTLCKPLRRLRYLSLHYCYLEKVELEAPNLTSVDLTNRPIPLALSESLKVMEANIKLLHKSVLYGDNLDYICTELLVALPHVQKLSITLTLYIYDEVCQNLSQVHQFEAFEFVFASLWGRQVSWWDSSFGLPLGAGSSSRGTGTALSHL